MTAGFESPVQMPVHRSYSQLTLKNPNAEADGPWVKFDTIDLSRPVRMGDDEKEIRFLIHNNPSGFSVGIGRLNSPENRQGVL